MVVALNQTLYEEFGLQGNQADYYNPVPGLPPRPGVQQLGDGSMEPPS